MSGTSVGTTSFVIGRELDGNREVLTYVHGETYDVDYDTKTAYTVVTTRFPYLIAQ